MTYAPAQEDPGRPTMMQKTIAPSQVTYYLERGYDRVSGFVHRAPEVAHLNTPAKLTHALGLGYAGSPFARTPTRSTCCAGRRTGRVSTGSRTAAAHEAAMRAMEGWVIERPPFRGNGFAPGESSDVIAEFKVDSARLPHGAADVADGSDGSETLVATFDGDAPTLAAGGDAVCATVTSPAGAAGSTRSARTTTRSGSTATAPGRRLHRGPAGPVSSGWCRPPRSRTWRTCVPPAGGRASRSSCSAQHDDWLRVEYTGGRAGRAHAGPGGVRLRRVPGLGPQAQVTDLREYRLNVSVAAFLLGIFVVNCMACGILLEIVLGAAGSYRRRCVDGCSSEFPCRFSSSASPAGG